MSRIVDLGGLAGAYAARLLAESGHDVIRIDPPEGDSLRRTGPFLGDAPDVERGAFHHFLNAGKRSLSLNLASSTARQLFMDLLQRADALIGTEPLPIREEELTARKPDLVLAVIEEAEAEVCASARSGLLSLTGQPNARPVALGSHMVYSAVGTYAAVGIAAALGVLGKKGHGQVVRISMRECLETFVEQAMVEYTFSGTKNERRGNRGSITAVSGALPCKDGYWVISQINRPGRWEKFTEWVQDAELMADPSLALDENQRKKKDFIMDRILPWASQRTKSELVQEGQRRHFPASPVSTPLDLVKDPQLAARGFLGEIDHPRLGRVTFPQGPIATVRGQKMAPAPSLGQHNAEVLAELGYSDEEHQMLVEIGAL